MLIDPVGWYLIVLVVLLLPWMAVKTARYMTAAEAGTSAKPMPVGSRLMVRVLCFQVFMTGFGLYAAHTNGVVLFPPPAFRTPELLIGAAFLAGGIGTMPWRFRTARVHQQRRLALHMPQTGREWLLFGPIALAAGFGEEVIYRGVLVELLQRAFGNWWLAAAISAVAFSVAHCTQGRRAVLLILGFTALFHALVRLTGSLYLVIALHTLYDLGAGMIFGRLTRGLRPVPVSPVQPVPAA